VLWVFINDECVEHGSAERAVPMAKIVVVLALGFPFDFEDVPADFAFMHGFVPLLIKEKGDPVMESPFNGL
jgi:hypothetical protein